ncbi:MAG: bifunctional UDP-N-acetylglucosamine diphosphorylase/glucosamine-1-phosphate N-acetyltransferase GlmU [Legionella sp.]
MLHVIILAAGQGKRMYSATPKVLHPIGGKAMLARVVAAAQLLNPVAIHVIIGHGAEQIKQALPELPVNWIIQQQQLGTGHAVMQALPFIMSNSQVLILSGDVPLITGYTLQALLSKVDQTHPLALLLSTVSEPFGLGRIVRDQYSRIAAIIEEKDATHEQRKIQEIYTGICCVHAEVLARWLPRLSNENAQQEYYLTEIISMAVNEGIDIASLITTNHLEIQGVNNRLQLHQLERDWQQRLTNQLLLTGVSLADSSRLDIRGELICGQDVFIDVNNVFIGHVIVGDGCRIGPNCVITNSTLAENCVIHPNSVIDGCQLGHACEVGPFARLRPATVLADQSKIGNFVETKNAVLGSGSKASHLSYLGDVEIGKQVNIGAGTITCNYDGAFKHKTIIEDGAFIGSDTQLVAPVIIGENATVGAGSTIRRNVPPGELTLTESKQKTLYGWVRPKKKPPA